MKLKQFRNYKLAKIMSTALFCIIFFNLNAQVTLFTDYTSGDDKKEPLHEIWNVANRISPTNGSNVRAGTDINLVRMVGGIVKMVDGKRVPNLEYDPCRYDSVNNEYVYNWSPLIDRLSKIVNGQTKIHQLVLDQPPWAFQHGYEFIPEGTTDNVHFREDERISIYGNSLPPANKEAYFDFVKAMIEKLVDTFGEEEVMSWRFRVGSEIETPDHWFGTEQDFIEHFANTEKAVRTVLPNAKIGVHTRMPGYLYKNGVPKNYKNEPIASFIEGLIEYCHNNGVQYDFWGITDYVNINGNRTDMSVNYDRYYKAFRDNPKWNHNATLDMMEYSTITKMAALGNAFINCATTHKQIIELSMSNMYYRNGINKVFRWGLRNTEPPEFGSLADLRTMVGNDRYETTISGNPKLSSNKLDAIYSKSENGFDVMVYNFNGESRGYVAEEPINLTFATDLPIGSNVLYRNNSYSIEQNKWQQFLLKKGKSWIISGQDEKGDPAAILTDEGYEKYKVFTDYKPLEFSDWQSVVTVARTDGGTGSMVVVNTSIPSFAYKKFEFRQETEFVTAIAPTKVLWTTSEDFAPWQPRNSGMLVNTDNDKLTLTYTDGNGFPMAGIAGLNIQAELYDKLRLVLKNTSPEGYLQMAANVPGTGFEAGRLRTAVANDGTLQVLEINLNDWIQWTGTIIDLKIYNNTNSGALEIDTIELVHSTTTKLVNVSIEQEGIGFVNHSSGSCFAGQTFRLRASPEPGWILAGWAGDVTVTQNPTTVVVNSDMNIKAIFKKKHNVAITKQGQGTLSHSSGTFAKGEEITLTATPQAGWTFSNWSGDVNSTENPLAITINADMNIVANFETITSINNRHTEKIVVYPNPSNNGHFNVDISENQPWDVYNTLGVKVLSGKGSTIDLSAFSKGIYHLRIKNNHSTLLYK